MSALPEPDESPARIPPREPPRTAVGASLLPPGRHYLVAHGPVLIGRTRLEYPLPFPGAVAGRFLPEPEYEMVRPVFRLYEAAKLQDRPDLLRDYVKARDALELRILDVDGTEIEGRVDLISHWRPSTSIIHLTIT